MITLPERIRQLEAGHVRRSGSWSTRARSKTHRKLLKGGPGGLRGRRRPKACPTERSWGVGGESKARFGGDFGVTLSRWETSAAAGKGVRGGILGLMRRAAPWQA